MDRNLHDSGATRPSICQWYDSHRILAGDHGGTGGSGVCDASSRGEDFHFGMILVLCGVRTV